MIDKFDPRRDYWPRLESRFYELLHALAQNPDDPKAATDRWKSDLQSVARDCLKSACAALGTSPHAICAVAQIDLDWPFNLEYLHDPQEFVKAKKLREAQAKTSAKKAASTSDSASQMALNLSS